jgi:hypothetical protein
MGMPYPCCQFTITTSVLYELRIYVHRHTFYQLANIVLDIHSNVQAPNLVINLQSITRIRESLLLNNNLFTHHVALFLLCEFFLYGSS